MKEVSHEAPGAKTVSPDEAGALKSDGDWIDEGDWLHLLKTRENPLTDGLRDATPFGLLETRGRRQELVDALRDRFEHCIVADSAGGMHLSLGNGVIYKAGAAIRESMADVLSIIIAVLTTSNYFFLLAAWTGFSTWKIVRNLIRGYERLTDPVERQVLETIVALSGRMAVTNYDALADGDYERAYGHVSPSTAEITAACRPDRSAAEVEAALTAMQEREIVINRNKRWAVRF